MKTQFTVPIRARHLKLIGVALLLTCLCALGNNSTDQPNPQHMMAAGYYFREPTDREWHLTIVGKVPSLPGCYWILHDADGNQMLRTKISPGTYTHERPLRFNFPKDGRTGDYKLVVLGQQDDLLGPRMPLSDLPYECYGGTYFTAGHNDTPIYFRPPGNATELTASAHAGNVRIYDGQTRVADAIEQGEKDRHRNVITFNVKPNTLYRVERQTFYFHFKPAVHLVFDPARWFEPNAKLNEINWWEVK